MSSRTRSGRSIYDPGPDEPVDVGYYPEPHEFGYVEDPSAGCTIDGIDTLCSIYATAANLHSLRYEWDQVGPNGILRKNSHPIEPYGMGLFGVWLPDDARGNDKTLDFYLLNFYYPQNQIIHNVSLGNLEQGMSDLLKKKDCAAYLQKLLNEANSLFGGNYPHINTFWEGYNKITGEKGGGYQLDGVASNGGTVSGDLFAYGANKGTVHLTPYRTINREPTAREIADARARYAYTAVHETFHLARQGGYDDYQMAVAAYSLANLPVPTNIPRENYLTWSGRFDYFLGQHCPNDTTPLQKKRR